jgi:hypothetical protein
VPFALVDFLETRRAADAGDVDQQMQAAERLHHVFDRRLN